MLRVGIDMDEFKKYSAVFKNFRTVVWQQFLREYVLKLATQTMSKTMLRTPVDTGALRSSWRITGVHRKGNSFEVEVYSDQSIAHYGYFVEFGHFTVNRDRFIEGRYMLTISVGEVDRLTLSQFEQQWKSYLRKVGLD